MPDDALGRSSSNAPGVNVYVTRSDLPEGFGATILVRFTKAEQASVDALLRSICRGAPDASARVLVAGSSPIDPDVEFTSNGDPSTVALRMTVDVATTAQHVALSDGLAPEDLRNGALAHPLARRRRRDARPCAARRGLGGPVQRRREPARRAARPHVGVAQLAGAGDPR